MSLLRLRCELTKNQLQFHMWTLKDTLVFGMNKLLFQPIFRKVALKLLQITHFILMEKQLESIMNALEMEKFPEASQKPFHKTLPMLNLKSNLCNFLTLADNIGSLDWASNTNIQLLAALTINNYGFYRGNNTCRKTFIILSSVT